MHYDMDSFYASIEIRDNQKLKGKPLVVGKTIVTTASYEARKFGIHSAMPTAEAKKLCPELISVEVSKNKYGRISREIQSLVKKLSNKVEFIALDEGYVDITDIINKYPSKEYFANRFKKGILNNVNLTCSIGIGYNKLSAKIASDINKPGGIYIFNTREEFVIWIAEKPVKIIPGAGKKTVERLEKIGVFKVKNLLKYNMTELIGFLGNSSGQRLYQYSRGYDYREIDHNRKMSSIGTENTFKYKLDNMEDIKKELDTLFKKAYSRLEKKEVLCKTISIKIRYESRKVITRSKSYQLPISKKSELYKTMIEIIDNIDIEEKVKLLGVTFANLSKETIKQLTFYDQYKI